MRKSRRGSVFVETALAFTMLVPIFYGTFQFGLGFLYYNELTNAVRAGARYAATLTYDSSNSTPSSTFTSNVQNLVVYGNPAGGTSPVVRSLQPSNVRLTVSFANSVPKAVTVSIHNYPLNMLFQTLNINKPSATFPYFGHYAPPAN